MNNQRAKARWLFINKKGKIVINPRFDDAYPFSERLANVGIGGRWGFISR